MAERTCMLIKFPISMLVAGHKCHLQYDTVSQRMHSVES